MGLQGGDQFTDSPVCLLDDIVSIRFVPNLPDAGGVHLLLFDKMAEKGILSLFRNRICVISGYSQVSDYRIVHIDSACASGARAYSEPPRSPRPKMAKRHNCGYCGCVDFGCRVQLLQLLSKLGDFIWDDDSGKAGIFDDVHRALN